jgi:hypothetical protein
MQRHERGPCIPRSSPSWLRFTPPCHEFRETSCAVGLLAQWAEVQHAYHEETLSRRALLNEGVNLDFQSEYDQNQEAPAVHPDFSPQEAHAPGNIRCA